MKKRKSLADKTWGDAADPEILGYETRPVPVIHEDAPHISEPPGEQLFSDYS